jgi:release factor glutamine methyltransferase
MLRKMRTEIIARLRAAGCVFAEDEAELLMSAARTPEELDAMVGRRVAGLPLEQVVGWAEFCGLRIAVEPGKRHRPGGGPLRPPQRSRPGVRG